mgnify:CR=1 FL=1
MKPPRHGAAAAGFFATRIPLAGGGCQFLAARTLLKKQVVAS